MRTLVFAATYLLVVLVGCAPAPVVEAPHDRVAPVVDRTLHVDTSCSPRARDALVAASAAWVEVSSGRAVARYAWDLDALTLMTLAYEPMVICSHRSDVAPDCAGNVDGDVVRLVESVCPDLYACALHELGHFFGIRKHVPYGHAVMSARRQVRSFAVADIAACAAVGLCTPPRMPDITTVTVTVDPAIPNIDLEYPK